MEYISDRADKKRISAEVVALSEELNAANMLNKEEIAGEIAEEMREITVYNKFIPQVCGKESSLQKRDVVRDDFYKEKEWRYSPTQVKIAKIPDLDERFLLASAKEYSYHIDDEMHVYLKEQRLLTFNWSDIRELIVTTEAEKNELLQEFEQIEQLHIPIVILPDPKLS